MTKDILQYINTALFGIACWLFSHQMDRLDSIENKLVALGENKVRTEDIMKNTIEHLAQLEGDCRENSRLIALVRNYATLPKETKVESGYRR